MGGAVVLLVAAVVVLSLLTTPVGEVAAPTTSTAATTTTEAIEAPTTTIDIANFSIADIARGNPFRWTRTAQLGDFWPVGLLEHEDQVLLFGSTDRGYAWAAEGGLEAWASPNGIIWDYLGEVVDPSYRIHHVASTDSGLVALGSRITDGSPHVLFSSNGLEWEPTELPTTEHFDETHVSSLMRVIELDGRLLVFGRTYRDPLAMLVDHLPEEVVSRGILPHGWTTSNSSEGVSIHLFGPLGLIGYTATLDELGIEDPTDLFGSSQDERTFIWTSGDLADWDLETFEGVFFYDVWEISPGELTALGWGPRGHSVLTSSDGIVWEENQQDAFRTGIVMTMWDGALIGQTGTPDLYRSVDGEEWQSMGIGGLLPIQLHWGLHPVEAGEAGLAVVASRDLDTEAAVQLPVVISKDDYALTVDLSGGNITIDRPDGTSHTVPIWQARPSPLVSVDFVSELVTFNDPDTGEPLVSIDFAALERAESSAYSHRSETERALLFTRDGEEWGIQGLERVVGDSTEIERMLVLDDRVVMITYQAPLFGLSPEPPTVSAVVGEIR